MDELDAFMATNASTLKAETCSRIANQLTDIKEEISKCSKLLALVAPVDLSKQKADVITTPVADVKIAQETSESDKGRGVFAKFAQK